MQRGTCAEVSRDIGAAPEALYALVSDVRRMGEWSPECRACHWIGGATGPAAGARFRGTNRRGIVRWSTLLEVVTARPGEEFSFVKIRNDQTKWTFRFERHGSRTRVTESFELQRDLPRRIAFMERWLIGIKDRKADLERGMHETLRRLESAAAAGAAPAPPTSTTQSDKEVGHE